MNMRMAYIVNYAEAESLEYLIRLHLRRGDLMQVATMQLYLPLQINTSTKMTAYSKVNDIFVWHFEHINRDRCW